MYRIVCALPTRASERTHTIIWRGREIVSPGFTRERVHRSYWFQRITILFLFLFLLSTTRTADTVFDAAMVNDNEKRVRVTCVPTTDARRNASASGFGAGRTNGTVEATTRGRRKWWNGTEKKKELGTRARRPLSVRARLSERLLRTPVCHQSARERLLSFRVHGFGHRFANQFAMGSYTYNIIYSRVTRARVSTYTSMPSYTTTTNSLHNSSSTFSNARPTYV